MAIDFCKGLIQLVVLNSLQNFLLKIPLACIIKIQPIAGIIRKKPDFDIENQSTNIYI